MPQIVLECLNQEVANRVIDNFDLIEAALREASVLVIGYKFEEFVVQVPPPLLTATNNADLLTIKPFPSARDNFTLGKEEAWCVELALAWHSLLTLPSMAELRAMLPDDSVAVWSHIAPGAKWGLVSEIVANRRNE